MVGTIHRVTVYDGRVSEEIILSHADAFRGIVRPPSVLFFSATPDTILTPGSATLNWSVRDAAAVYINGVDESAVTNLTVSPATTTTYVLVASNLSGSATSQVAVRVNPAPAVDSFAASRTYARPGETILLAWDVNFAKTISIEPDIGDVTSRTSQGKGSIAVQPAVSATYQLTAENDFGATAVTASVHVVEAAGHLVVSEFMATTSPRWRMKMVNSLAGSRSSIPPPPVWIWPAISSRMTLPTSRAGPSRAQTCRRAPGSSYSLRAKIGLTRRPAPHQLPV